MDEPEILVCYDGSASAREAISQTASLHHAAQVFVLSVWQPVAGWAPSVRLVAADVREIDRRSEGAAAGLAANGGAIAKAAGLRARAGAAESSSSTAQTILDWAQDHDSKLIVIGATGHASVADTPCGSVANAVVHNAAVPVLLVRATASE